MSLIVQVVNQGVESNCNPSSPHFSGIKTSVSRQQRLSRITSISQLSPSVVISSPQATSSPFVGVTGEGASPQSMSQFSKVKGIASPKSQFESPPWGHSPSRSHKNNTQPHTPQSTTQSGLDQTPGSRTASSHSSGRSRLASPSNTFGIRTPPGSVFTFCSAHDTAYFTCGETPPPLPPLDHPAFRVSSRTASTSQGTHQLFPIKSSSRISHSLRMAPRHAHSLPSFPKTRPKTHSDTTVHGGIKEKHRTRAISRQRSHSNTRTQLVIANQELITPPTKGITRGHKKSQSKASISSSRRSSAEYSTKKASSIGNEGEYGGSWEVQVAKEIVRISVGGDHDFVDQQAGPVSQKQSSVLGKRQARGNNVGGFIFSACHNQSFLTSLSPFFAVCINSRGPKWLKGWAHHFYCKVCLYTISFTE